MSKSHPPFAAISADPLPALVRALRGPNAADRLQAAKDLARLGWLAREALPALVAALDDDDAKVREVSAQAIGNMGPDALPTLSGMLTHFDKYVRRHAVWAMGKLGPLASPALEDLCACLKNTDPRTASGAAQSLGNMGAAAAEAVPALAEAMRGTNIVLCRLAAKALSQIGSSALSTLIAHLQHSDPFVRGESAMAIGWMGPTALTAVPFLVQLVRGPRISTGRTPPPTPSPLAPKSGHDSGAWAGNSQSVTPTQTPPPEPDTTEESCRSYAAQALGRIGRGASAALPELREAARSGSEPLRAIAQQAIRLIEGEPNAPR
jgi:HEAT repeat protein